VVAELEPAGPRLVLASGSPRRAEILRQLAVPFNVRVSNVDETLLPDEGAEQAVERLARVKADVVARQETLPVLAADTCVVCDDEILGKPADEAEARSMLRRLSGRSHEVLTGLCVMGQGQAHSGVERSVVTMAALSDEEVGWYVATGEPLDKAGAYHVHGRGALFIEDVQGSPSNVAGLPVRLLLQLVRSSGLDLGWPRT